MENYFVKYFIKKILKHIKINKKNIYLNPKYISINSVFNNLNESL